MDRYLTYLPREAARVAIFACVLCVFAACCDKPKLSLGRIEGFVGGVFSLEASFDWSLSVPDLSFSSLATWSGLAALSIENAISLGIRISADATFRTATIRWDMDNDAWDEDVEILIITIPGSLEQPQFICKWSGDKYTLDEDKMYVGWVDVTDGTTHLVASAQGNSQSLMICESGFDGEDETICSGCNMSLQCDPCDEGESMPGCIVKAETASFEVDSAFSSNWDTDSEWNTDVGVDTSLGVDTNISVDTDISLDTDFTLDTDISLDTEFSIDLGF